MLAASSARRLPIALVGLVLGASLLAACAPKATQADCEKLGDHMIEVVNRNQDASSAALMKPIMDKLREKEIGACTGKMTVAEVKCGMDAKTGADMDKCLPKK
jgi:hypothetical protein